MISPWVLVKSKKLAVLSTEFLIRILGCSKGNVSIWIKGELLLYFKLNALFYFEFDISWFSRDSSTEYLVRKLKISFAIGRTLTSNQAIAHSKCLHTFSVDAVLSAVQNSMQLWQCFSCHIMLQPSVEKTRQYVSSLEIKYRLSIWYTAEDEIVENGIYWYQYEIIEDPDRSRPNRVDRMRPVTHPIVMRNQNLTTSAHALKKCNITARTVIWILAKDEVQSRKDPY